MPWTLDDLKAAILAGARAQIVIAVRGSFSGATPDDSAISAWLNWPIGSAIRGTGYAVATPSSVADGDLAVIPANYDDRILAAAYLATKRQILGSLALYDQKQNLTERKFSQLAEQIRDEIKELAAEFKLLYGSRAGGAFVACGEMTGGADLGAGGLLPTYPPPDPDYPIP
jgi:hypothetical protein